MREITVDGVVYVEKYPQNDSSDFVLVRSADAGVFAGPVEEMDLAAGWVRFEYSIRLWQWTGFTLSQVARDGTAGSEENIFSVRALTHTILGVCEILPCTTQAKKSILEVEPRAV